MPRRQTVDVADLNQQSGVTTESGISERPTRVRTWGLKGRTHIIQFHCNWNHVSIIAGLTRANCLFRLHEGSIS